MKKTFKRITAMLMTAALAGSASMMAMSAFADYTVTFEKKSGSNDTAKHTYEAYQVFKGDMSGTGADAVLSNIDWGTGVNATNLLSALKTSTAFGTSSPFADCTDAASVAKVIDGWDDNDANIQKFADLVGANLGTVTVTGTEGNISVTGTATGDVSTPTFTGNKVQLAGTTTAAGTVSQPSFTGTEGTVTVS